MCKFFQARARSFKFAFAGLKYLISSQPNARIHLIATVVVCTMALVFQLTMTDWIALVFAVSLVWITEAVNTAIETAVNLTTSEIHPLAKNAKDVAACAVLIAALTSVVIGILVLGPPLYTWLISL